MTTRQQEADRDLGRRAIVTHGKPEPRGRDNEVERLRAVVARCSAVARAAEPKSGWGTRSLINDAWADGFRTAAVQISDLMRKAAEAGEQS